LVESAILCDLI